MEYKYSSDKKRILVYLTFNGEKIFVEIYNDDVTEEQARANLAFIEYLKQSNNQK